MSEQGGEACEANFVPHGAFERPSQQSPGHVFLHDVEQHVAQDGDILQAVAQSGPGLIFVYGDA